MQVVTEATIESLQSKFNELQAQANEARQGADKAKAAIASLTEQRRSLLIAGDAASLADALKLEATLKDLGRTQEAYQFRLEAISPQIAEVQQELLSLQQKAAHEERIRKTEEFSQTAARLADEKHALWRKACHAAYAEALFHSQTVASSGLLQSQISQVRQVGIDAHEHRGNAYNEKWERTQAFVQNLVIEPIDPR